MTKGKTQLALLTFTGIALFNALKDVTENYGDSLPGFVSDGLRLGNPVAGDTYVPQFRGIPGNTSAGVFTESSQAASTPSGMFQ